MPDHALLSASSSHRWLACPPSAKLCATHPDRASPYAQQGTDAHELAAYKVQRALGMKARDPTEDLEYFDQEMADCTDAYCAFVMEQLAEARKHCADPIVLVEQRLDFSKWVPEGFGTGDACIVADNVLHVIDLKYGLGILVDAERNPQMMCYALGLLETFDGIYDVSTVRMTIFQPRRENVSTFEISKADLLSWADTVLAPTARLAFKGEGEFRAGDHCQFCTAKASCRKRAEYNLEMARYDFEVPSELTDEEIAAILPRIDELITWGDDVKEYALQQAVSGTHYPGFKVVEGRSVTRYTNEEAVAAAVTAAGEDPYERKLLGLTAMKALLGKKRFDDILGGLTFKPPGKPTLVPESDKRPAMNTAKNDFSVDALMESMIENDLLAFRDGCVHAFSHIEREALPSSAGTGTPLTDIYEREYVFLRNSRSVCRADTVITVSGDSMTPTFQNGDELLVEFTPEIEPGEIGIFVIAGEGFVKEYQPDGLHSHNPKYKTIHPGPDDNFRCVGRVLGVVTQDMYPTAQELDVLNEVYSDEHKR